MKSKFNIIGGIIIGIFGFFVSPYILDLLLKVINDWTIKFMIRTLFLPLRIILAILMGFIGSICLTKRGKKR